MTSILRLGSVYRNTRNRLRDANIPAPDLDARLLLADLLEIEPLRVLVDIDCLVSEDIVDKLESQIRARINGRPVGRILGYSDFWGIKIKLNDATFEPRTDTEILVENVLNWLKSENRHREKLNIVDIGTGSGAILVALLGELPNAYGIGTDISIKALNQAKENLTSAGLFGRSNLVCCSYSDALTGTFDVIVSNPPYVTRSDIELLTPEVKDNDPIAALDGGEDGLKAFGRLCLDNTCKLNHQGRIFVEIGYNQLQSVSKLFINAGYGNLKNARDLSGNDRVISASWE